MSRLLNSAKFWVMIVDVVVSLVAYFVGKYAVPAIADDVMFLIGSLQPVFVAVIVGIFVEDAAVKRGLGAAGLQVQADAAEREHNAAFWQARFPERGLGEDEPDVAGALAVLREAVSGEAVEVLDKLQAYLTDAMFADEPVQ